MNSTELYVLPDSAVMTPVRELPEVSRRNIGVHDDGDVILSRANSRAFSKLLGAQASELLDQFRKPKTIAHAVAQFSHAAGLDAERALEDALPVLRCLIEAGFLVVPDAESASATAPSLLPLSEIDGWTILQLVQTMEDTEVYQVRSRSGEIGALKISRAIGFTAKRAMEHEAYVLSRLDSVATPHLLSLGYWNSRPYLVTEWFAGTDAAKVCAELRTRNDAYAKNALLLVTGGILRVYAAIHERGVVHGDVHPRNVLLDNQHSVKVLDFGAARLLGSEKIGAAVRPGVSFFFEPELAEAAQVGACLPFPSEQGEQYSLGVLTYFLLTGSHYLDFIFEKTEMLRQIAEDQMLPFQRRGLEAWPEAEWALWKALNKKPAERFSSVAEFARVWELVSVPSRKF